MQGVTLLRTFLFILFAYFFFLFFIRHLSIYPDDAIVRSNQRKPPYIPRYPARYSGASPGKHP